VKELISLGADIHATNKIGNTALHIAAYSGFIDVCKVRALLHLVYDSN
jgi:ankyrin repeat protein